MAQSVLELRLLGQFDIRLGDAPISIPSRPAQSLLAYLALTAGTAHRRERLAALLWPDVQDDSARASLRQGLWRIRKALEARLPAGVQYLLADDLTVSFNANSSHWLDTAVLDAPLDESASVEGLQRAVVVYRGDLLPGFYEEWVLRERERLEGVFERKIGRLLDCLVALRRWPEVLEWAERWIAVGHVPEPAYRALMLAHSERGDRARIATVYQRCRELLFEELGAQPSEQTRELFERLSRGERALALTAVDPARGPLEMPIHVQPPAPGEPPFQGLQLFDARDAERFFGREAITARLVERLHSEPFLAAIGASGSGKSSLVRAGVVPAVRRAAHGGVDWLVHVLTPAIHPLESLALALTRDEASTGASALLLDQLTADPRGLRFWLERCLLAHQHALLVVDQFEELFTLCRDPFEREAFVDNLLETSQGGGAGTVLISLRADFYPHCAQYPELRQALADHQEYLGPMSSHELRRAIELPAKRGEWKLEPGLVDLFLRDVGEEPGALPLLSHALLETWHRRHGRSLTLQAYAETGGVRGAIAQTAESLFHDRLSSEQQAIARRIFLRLTELGEGTQDTRRRAHLDELVPSPEAASSVRTVVRMLADARLITLSEDTAEVAHEALIREWPTLRAWLDEDRAGLRLHQHLAESAQEWLRLARDPDVLYRGPRLAQAREWVDAHPGELIPLERSFLEASLAHAEREAAAREAQQQHELDSARRTAEAERQRAETESRRAEEQQRASRRLRRRAVYLSAALVFALAMAGLAMVFGDQARQSAASAQTSADVAFARELASAAVGNLEVDPERSILLALQAVGAARAQAPAALRETQEALHRALQASRIQLTLRGHAAGVFSLAFSPDGRSLASIDQDGVAKLWDPATGLERLTVATDTHGNYINAGIAFSPDGSTFATIQRNRTARLWDTATGAPLLDLAEQVGPGEDTGNGGPVMTLAFSPDGARLATGATDGTARVFDLATGQERARLAGPRGQVWAVAFSPDGSRLASAGYDDGTTHVWDLDSGQDLLTLVGHSEPVESVAFSPDGGTIATASDDATTQVWAASSGQHRLTLYGHVSHVASLAFDPAGTRLVTASEDGYARVWDVATGRDLVTLAGHTSGVLAAAWTPDGTHVATASRDTTVRLWDVSATGGGEGPTLVGHSGRVMDVAFSPDGLHLATAGTDRTARVWDARTGQMLVTLVGHTSDVNTVAFSPNASELGTTSSDGTARVWDAATGDSRLVLNSPGPSQGLGGLAWSQDGHTLSAATGDSTVGVWDTSTGAQELRFEYPSFIQRLALSPDGAQLAAAGGAGRTLVWNPATGSMLFGLDSRTTLVNGVAYSPDGRLLATTGNDSMLRLWDARSGRELLARSGAGNFGVAFSPDGRRLANSSVDRTVRIWTVAGDDLSAEQPMTLSGHAAAVYRVTWSPDGHRLATASRDGTSRVYIVDLDELVALARSKVTRGLSAEECQKFIRQDHCPGREGTK